MAKNRQKPSLEIVQDKQVPYIPPASLGKFNEEVKINFNNSIKGLFLLQELLIKSMKRS